jgi:hypothetical protein
MIVGLQAHDGAFRMEYRSDGGSLEEGSHNTKNLSVNSDDLGTRWSGACIARGNMGEDTFQDASDQVMDCLGCVLGEG